MRSRKLNRVVSWRGHLILMNKILKCLRLLLFQLLCDLFCTLLNNLVGREWYELHLTFLSRQSRGNNLAPLNDERVQITTLLNHESIADDHLTLLGCEEVPLIAPQVVHWVLHELLPMINFYILYAELSLLVSLGCLMQPQPKWLKRHRLIKEVDLVDRGRIRVSRWGELILRANLFKVVDTNFLSGTLLA